MRDVILFKERNKKMCSAMRSLHYVRDIGPDVFESRNIKLKDDAKDRNYFLSFCFHIPPKLSCLLILEIT
ncbi:Uncharacterised protein [Bartonella grahamii]|uniref:Uncharacterized protein n=1 Tax=Bartonella grahamii TaxID=33045 RepID=A0A336NCC4_BARGR|nr:Uncharacterised protein [Bartonella grahamii]